MEVLQLPPSPASPSAGGLAGIDPGPFRSLCREERPRERMERHGAGALSDSELLAILVRSGTAGHDVMRVSGEMLRQAGSLARLVRWTVADFERIRGVGRVKAQQLAAVMEVARRAILRTDREKPSVFDDPEKVWRFFQPVVAGLDVEYFWVLVLNRKNHLVRSVEVTRGIADASLVHPREVFREVIREGGSAAIVAHNHPSGDPAPSAADVRVTRQLREAARTLDIGLLDHVVIGEPSRDPAGAGFYSFADSGLL
ncbi:MAG: RadC family protein [Puniceicoccaceae bacterium]